MRFKWVPEPPNSVAAVAEAQRAIPLVPTSESDSLRRLVDRTDGTGIDDQDDAREWLTFLRALGVVDQTPSGYRRYREDLSERDLPDRLLDTVYGAHELYGALEAAEEPLSVDDLDAKTGVDLPTWERHHHGTDHEQVRRRRLRRLAEWFVLCGVAERTPEGYQLKSES
jgi:hypothetical protein